MILKDANSNDNNLLCTNRTQYGITSERNTTWHFKTIPKISLLTGIKEIETSFKRETHEKPQLCGCPSNKETLIKL